MADLAAATVDAGATAWVLTSTALVFLMTAGLSFFYGGLVRDTNIINTMMMSIVSMGVVTMTWVILGFSIAFGENGPVIGNADYALFMNLDMAPWGESGLPGLCFACFQMTFAIIASAIISGSLVERMRFSAYVVLIALWSLVIYAPLCHWVWGPGGWIEELGAKDFAGGTVVHISSGVSGFVASGLVGARRHVEKDHGPANAPFVILGGSLLWFGWLGFNGGSALAVTDGVASRAVATTLIAAASSMLTWIFMERLLKGKSSSVGAMAGAVAGLVCITPAAGFVTPGWSILFGVFGAPWCYVSVELLNKLNFVDDTLDAFGLHGMGGIWGAVLTGIFALEEGLIYSGSFLLIGKQIAGALAGAAFSAVGTAIIVLIMKLVVDVRVPEDHERSGVDEHTHGEFYHSPVKAYKGPVKEYQAESEGSTEDVASDCGGPGENGRWQSRTRHKAGELWRRSTAEVWAQGMRRAGSGFGASAGNRQTRALQLGQKGLRLSRMPTRDDPFGSHSMMLWQDQCDAFNLTEEAQETCGVYVNETGLLLKVYKWIGCGEALYCPDECGHSRDYGLWPSMPEARVPGDLFCFPLAMGTWGAAGLEAWTRDAEAARAPSKSANSAGGEKHVEGLAWKQLPRPQSSLEVPETKGGTVGDVNSRRYENAVWRLMQKEKRSFETWNEECLRKAVATIGQEIDFRGLTSATFLKQEVAPHSLAEPLGGPAVSRKRRQMESRAAVPNPTGGLDVQRLENAMWRLWPRESEQRAWQPWYSAQPEKGAPRWFCGFAPSEGPEESSYTCHGLEATEQIGSQIDFTQVQRLLQKQDPLGLLAARLAQRVNSMEASQSTGTPVTPRSVESSQDIYQDDEDLAKEEEQSNWVAIPAVYVLGGILLAVGAFRFGRVLKAEIDEQPEVDMVHGRLTTALTMKVVNNSGTFSAGPNTPSSGNFMQSFTPRECPVAGCPQPAKGPDGYNLLRRWSDASGWPDGQLPGEMDNVVLPPEDNVLLDIVTPKLHWLDVQGRLEFDREKNTTLNAHSVKVWGKMEMGTAADPIPPNVKAEVVLWGDEQSITVIMTEGLFLVNKVVAVLGSLSAVGSPSTTSQAWTRLVSTADTGATQLIVRGNQEDWPLGAQVAISATEYPQPPATTETEVRKIASPPVYDVESDSTTLMLDVALVHRHFAGTVDSSSDTHWPQPTLAAAVALLEGRSNVIFRTGEEVTEHGGEVVIAGSADGNWEGVANISNVDFLKMGKHWYQAPALKFNFLASGSYPDFAS
ncbi:unnamed protein product [Effrenium voratum]|nr:unnamed protein product [Effrenium voratum]